MMKAIRVLKFGGPEVLGLCELPLPTVNAGEVLVKIKAAGVNPVDTYVRSGIYGALPSLPYTPGFDGAGVVESVDRACKQFKRGDRVYCAGSISGTYAEYALCKESQLHPLPDCVSFDEGAAVYVAYATAYRALFQRALAKPGEIVLVHGASGGVGSAAVQLASAAGLKVIGTAGSAEGLLLVKQMGADLALNHQQPGYLQTVMDLTENRGVNIILEMLANVNLNHDLSLLSYGGRVVIIGNRGKIEIDPRLTMGKDAAILGMSLMNVQETDSVQIHAALVSGLKNKTLKPVIGKRFKLEEAVAAHTAVMQGGAYGKILLMV